MTDAKQQVEWVEAGVKYLKLFNAFLQKHKDLVFYMSRSCDEKLYSYFANRSNNTLVPASEVTCASVYYPAFGPKCEVNGMLLDSFFKLAVRPIPDSKKYAAKLAGFPDREMTLHLKQDSKPGKNDGLVTSTSTLVVSGEAVKDVRVFCIHKDMTFNAMDIPDVKRIVVFGVAPKQNVSSKLAAHLHALSDTQFLVWEEFPVTQDLLDRFDIKKMTSAYIFGTKE